MPKYWGKQIFNHGRFPEVGQKEKTEKRERKNDYQKLVITMASYALQRHLAKMLGPIWQSGRGIRLIKPFCEKWETKCSAAIFSFVYFCDFPYKSNQIFLKFRTPQFTVTDFKKIVAQLQDKLHVFRISDYFLYVYINASITKPLI